MIGVLPSYQENFDPIQGDLNDQYRDMLEALEAMQKVSKDTPLANIVLYMHLLQNGILLFDDNRTVSILYLLIVFALSYC